MALRWLRDNLLWVLLLLFVVTGGLLLGVAGLAAFVFLSVLEAPAAGDSLVQLAVEFGLPLLGVGLALGTVALASMVGLLWVGARRVSGSSFPRDERLHALAERVERESDAARRLNLSARVEPRDPRTPEERRADALDDLKARYANGELSEPEFERRVESLLSDEPPGDERGDAEGVRGGAEHGWDEANYER